MTTTTMAGTPVAPTIVVTVTLRGPSAAAGSITKLTVSEVVLLTAACRAVGASSRPAQRRCPP